MVGRRPHEGHACEIDEIELRLFDGTVAMVLFDVHLSRVEEIQYGLVLYGMRWFGTG